MNKIETILQNLIDNLDEGIQIVDSKGRTIYYNDAMAKMEGIKKEEVLGKKVIEYLKGMEEESSTLMNALKTGDKYVDVIQHYSGHYDKKITTINTTIPIKYNGDTVAAVEISKDMTTLKELNEKICRLQSLEGLNNKRYYFKDIIGNSISLKKAINKAMRASLTNSSILIYGETGSGKEVFAQSIHYSGTRKEKPFVPINCAAIPSSLLEAMLFGTIKGSFTGAETKKGLFEEADGGTILLDEINSMEPALQSKLLRVLQEGYIRPIGSNTDIDIDVRIIATLNEEPEKLIKEGKLRKDFYYRLSVIRIDVPPLRERKDDIPMLISHFIDYYNKILAKDVMNMDDDMINEFMEYDWPGNIRELRNVIEAAMNMVDNNRILTREYFEAKKIINTLQKEYACPEGFTESQSLQEYLEKIEKDLIEKTFKKNNFNISKTASELKVTRQNLQYKLKKYALP